MIREVLRDLAVKYENVYGICETGVMLSMPGSVKVLVGQGDIYDCWGARVKRTNVTVIECISANRRYLNLMIIWPATTQRSNGSSSPPLDGSMNVPSLDIPTR